MSAEKITIFDTTLRDGEQSPGCSMNTAEKLEVARALVDLGVDVIAAGFPIASPGDFEAVREIASAITPVPGGVGPMTIAMLLANTLHAAQLAVSAKIRT